MSLEGEEFLARLERTIGFFVSLYGRHALIGPSRDAAVSAPLAIDGECAADELWSEAFLLYMEYLASGKSELYSRALAASEGVYRTLWRARASGKRMRAR